MQSFAIRQKSNRTTRTLGRLLVFAVIPFGALLVMRLAFAMSSGLGLFTYTIAYFALPHALFPVAGNSPLAEGYLWLLTLAVSVLVASVVTALRQPRVRSMRG
jgi:hypothetical protein